MSFLDTLKDGVGRAKDEAGKIAQAARLKLTVRQLDSKRNKLLRELGERVYSLRSGGVSVPDVGDTYDLLDGVTQEITTKETQIRAVRIGQTGEPSDEQDGSEGRAQSEDESHEAGPSKTP